jgi:hypothetical protein
MATGQELIQDSLLDIGVGSPGDDLDESILNHGLRILNRMWSSWSSEVAPVYASTLDELTWTAGEQSQTIGSGGDFDTARPIEITGFQARVNGVDYTLSPVSFEQYQMTPIKDINSNYPTVYAYQKTYPLGILHIYYEPQDALSVRITSKKPLTAFTLVGTVALPDGYELAIQSNLTIALAAAHGKQAKPSTIRTAINSKAAIEGVNEDDTEMSPDGMLPGISNGEMDDLGALTNG